MNAMPRTVKASGGEVQPYSTVRAQRPPDVTFGTPGGITNDLP